MTRFGSAFAFLAISLTLSLQVRFVHADGVPEPPAPEPISLRTLPLPPAIADDSPPGTCDAPTGCTGVSTEFASGSFLPDGRHVLVAVDYIGSSPESIYNGYHLLAVKSDGQTFENGDPWKCLTCGLQLYGEALEYPQVFRDGKRALFGINILDCGEFDLVSPQCDQDALKVYPIRWNISPDGSGEGGDLRELRLHPDNVHLGFNAFTSTGGTLGQFAYFSRLFFNPDPEDGLPLVPRYDAINVTRLFDPQAPQPVETDGDDIYVNAQAASIGELRAFNGDGKEVFYVGYPAESSNIDAFAISLETGVIRRLTEHPEYIDPLDSSPDGQWMAIQDTRGTDRQMWLSGMRFIPPITDLISTSVTSSTRNNGQRRFFQPYLLDKYGDRGEYFGQKLNDEGSGERGSGDFNDPEWNVRADPRWSPDGTEIVWWDIQTLPPACGDPNPLPCYPSKEPYGRTQRVVVAKLTSRQPYDQVVVDEVSDNVPWGVPYVPGSPDPPRPQPAPGKFVLHGQETGYADVEIYETRDDSNRTLSGVSVSYYDFSDVEGTVLNGMERVESRSPSASVSNLDWHSDLTQNMGGIVNTKKTGPGGFQISIDVLANNLDANGTFTTTLDGKKYERPANGT